LLLFAEGTRFTPAKHAASVEFANRIGMPPLQHLLLPRSKGFISSVEQLRGKFPAVYSCCLAFNTEEGATPSLKSLLLGRRVISEMCIERIPMENVPVDADKASEWLHESYRQKDNLLDMYKKNGHFPTFLPQGHYNQGPFKSHYRPRRLWSLIINLVSCYITLPPVFHALHALSCSGSFNILIALSMVAAASAALYKLIGLTKVSKASNYGDKSSSSSSDNKSA